MPKNSGISFEDGILQSLDPAAVFLALNRHLLGRSGPITRAEAKEGAYAPGEDWESHMVSVHWDKERKFWITTEFREEGSRTVVSLGKKTISKLPPSSVPESDQPVRSQSARHSGTAPSFPTTSFGVVSVSIRSYAYNELPSVELIDEQGASVTVLSTNLPEFADELASGEFFAKSWGENEELAAEALASGLFLDTGKREGIVLAPVWRFNCVFSDDAASR